MTCGCREVHQGPGHLCARHYKGAGPHSAGMQKFLLWSLDPLFWAEHMPVYKLSCLDATCLRASGGADTSHACSLCLAR